MELLLVNEIPRFVTAMAEWGSCMALLALLPKRNGKSIFAGISAAYLVLLTIFLEMTQHTGLILWWVFMLMAMGSMFAFLKIQSELTVEQTVFVTMLAFLLAEFSATFAWFFTAIMIFGGGGIWSLMLMLFLLIIVLAGAYVAERHILTEDYLQQISLHENIATLATVGLVFAFSNVGFVLEDYVYAERIQFASITGMVRTFVDACGLAILYAYQSRIREYMAEKESSSMQALLRSQYEQYRYYQNTQEMIHIKYHDLKHQITGLRAETDVEKRKEWLDRLEQELDEHHLVDRTGNQVLDTILGAKIFQGQKIHARFTCVCDGKLLDFMHVTDICTIFGNALDNALEAVAMIEDPEQRLIHLTVKKHKNFILIQVLNYCTNMENVADLTKGGHLKTSKADHRNHGFGIKSIRITAEKYGGSVNLDRKDGWFGLHIMLPIRT